MDKVSGVRGGDNVNFMIIAVYMGSFRHTVRSNKPDKKGIHSHRSGGKRLVNDGFCPPLIDLYDPFRRFLIWKVHIIVTAGVFVLANDM